MGAGAPPRGRGKTGDGRKREFVWGVEGGGRGGERLGGGGGKEGRQYRRGHVNRRPEMGAGASARHQMART